MRIKRYSDIEPVNEEILGKIVNFFKNMWNKAIQELEKLGNDPNDVKDYIAENWDFDFSIDFDDDYLDFDF
jgi:hypothetical protein